MAGVMFLYSKNGESEQFAKAKSTYKQIIESRLKSNFKRIEFRENHKSCFVTEFQKDDSEIKYFSDDSGNWLTFEGVVFALHETKMYSAEGLWQLYQNFGRNMANELDGHFIIKLYDAVKDNFLVINDFVKSRTNFICETEDYVLITPFLALAAVIMEPELDQHALNEFLWRYYIQSERTMLKNVSHLPAASIYQIENGKLSHETYWHWPKQYSASSYKESVDVLADSIKETARLIDGNFDHNIIEFTMGQDSRTVLSGFTSQGFDFQTAIFGPDDELEVRNVKRMSKKFGFKNHHIQLQDDFLDHMFDYFKLAVTLGSCEQPGFMLGRIFYMKSRYLPFAASVVNGIHGRYYKDGLWNEQYVMNLYREPKQVDVDKLLKFRILNAKYRNDIFSDSFLEIKGNSAEYFTELLRKSTAGYEKSSVAIQMDKYDLECYANFGNVANTTCSYAIEMLSPLLMRRNLEAALAMSPKWKYNLSQLQRGVVAKLDEDLARERTDFGEIDMMPKFGLKKLVFLSKYWGKQGKKFTGKIKKRMGMHVKTQLQKTWDYLPLYRDLFNNDEIQNLMNFENMELADILKKDDWNGYKKSFESPEFQTLDNYEFFYKLAGVEYFLRFVKEIHESSL